MAAARQESIFAATVKDVLEDMVPSQRKPASDATEWKCPAETRVSAGIRRSENTLVSLPSRFDQDFERLELFGRGAFGEVWRCRHRLDGREYAVKAVQYRIGADAGQIQQRVFREASTWAHFSHPNILRYHSSWTEVHRKQILEEETHSEFLPIPVANELMSALSVDTSGPHTADLADDWSFEESDGGVVFEASNLSANPQSPAPQDATAPPESVVFTATAATHDRTPPAIVHQGMRVVPGCRGTLYLQAELCRKDTLMSWITQRNAAMASGLTTLQEHRHWAGQGLNIFRQIVVGLAHLHAHRCAHRDVKPSNIMFGCDNNVRLGDFGLARFLEDAQPISLRDNNSSSSPPQGKSTLGAASQQHTRAVGTSSYASPEQLEGGPCGVETDVYALGMILAELLCPVSTHMERAVLLEGLRNGRKVLGKATSALKIATRLAVAMTSPDPMQRPLMCEILEVYPEVECEVLLCFGSETALLSSPCAAASRTSATAAAEATETDSTSAAVDGLHNKVFTAQCDEPISSSVACKSASGQILLQEEHASQTTGKTEEVTDPAKTREMVKEFSVVPDARAAGAVPSGCKHWPPFTLPTPRATQRARAGHIESDKAAQGHHRKYSVTPQITIQTTATWVPSIRGRRGRRRCCNGLGAAPIKHLSFHGRRHSVAGLPPYSVVGLCPL